MNTMPLVTVYLTTHNRLNRLKRALASVFGQTYKNIEIIVCDDASDDATNEYMRSIVAKHSNVKYIRNDVNEGACVARNMAIFSAKGEFITGLDDDDEFAADRVETFVHNWDDKYSFISCDFYEVYNDGKKNRYYNIKKKKEYEHNHLLYDNNASNQIFTRTSYLKEIGGFDKRVRRLQDWDTWLRLSAKYGKYCVLPFTTYIMHHDHSLNEKRVSKSYKSYTALEDFVDRNIGLYFNNKYLEIIKYTIDYEKGNARLFPSVLASLYSSNIKHFIKYIYQKLGFNPKG
ncbi:glycosyltransferase [Klebsiella aerogenes]|uniref:glycosyltransferase n=1 Tax=Klebsiella aerogenes TaxID=548 RepID=UPI001D0DA417|nr:glycosyltransferase [Klebsiella aerogenes]